MSSCSSLCDQISSRLLISPLDPQLSPDQTRHIVCCTTCAQAVTTYAEAAETYRHLRVLDSDQDASDWPLMCAAKVLRRCSQAIRLINPRVPEAVLVNQLALIAGALREAQQCGPDAVLRRLPEVILDVACHEAAQAVPEDTPAEDVPDPGVT